MNTLASSSGDRLRWRPLRTTSGQPVKARRELQIDRALLWLGFIALGATWVFPYSASGLLAPMWGIVTAQVIWLGHAILAWRISRSRPRLVPLVAVLSVVAWWSFLTLGEIVFGWTG